MSPFGGDGAFTALFQHAGVGIGQLGTDGRWLRANHQLLEILGYSAERIERLGYLDLVHPADLEEAQQLLRQVAEGEAPSLRREQRFCRSNGTEVWVRLTLSAAAAAGERPAFLIGVVEDISERRRALDALREQEIRLTEAQRIAGVGSWTHHLRSGRITLSLEASRILGLDPQRADFDIAEVLARVFVEDREVVREALERQVTTGGETVLQARIGSGAHEICVECRSRIELGGSGKPGAVVGTIQDVTQHRRAEERLRHQEAYLRAVIDANPNPVFAKDRDGRFTVANAAVADLYGTTPEDLIGRTDADFNPDAAQAAAFLAADREVIDSGVQRLVPEESVTHPVTGETRWLQTRKIRFVPPDKGAPQVLGVSVDITERRILEQQLRQSQKMEAIGRLAGGIAHDFNNLLTVIGGHTQLLLMDCAADAAEREDLEQIQAGVERAAALTRQLLAFSRKQILQPQLISINELVSGTERMLRRMIGEDVELISRLDADDGAVLADRGQLEQVLMNLAVNARDAMPEGGKLIIETHSAVMGRSGVHLHPYLDENTPAVLLTVSDTGTGMPKEVQTHIFEPFFTTKGAGHGTGLGLATVYGIVKQTGGYIWVYSEPGRGTTFKIYLPRAEAEADAIPMAALEAEVEGPARPATILLVEDEPAVREVATQSLERGGHTVYAVDGPDEAVRVAREHAGHIDLLITDVIMPGMNGRELANRILALQPELHVLYMSGYTDEAIVHHGVLEAGTQFIPKPFGPTTLNRRVAALLGGLERGRPGD